MIKIGIVGTDNSHSIAFSKLCNVKGEGKSVSGAKVVSIYGRDRKRDEEVAEKGQVPEIAERVEDMVAKVDAAIVDLRDGALHYRHARPFIEAGKPTFVDKPFAVKPEHAKKMVELAKKKKTPITSFSTVRLGPSVEKMKKDMGKVGKLRGGVVIGPGSAHSEYSGIFFYGIHCVELMSELFGSDVGKVRATEHGGSVIATLEHRGGAVVTLNIFDGGYPTFAARAYGLDGEATFEATDVEDGYYHGMKLFLEMVKTGRPPIPYADMIKSVRILEAMEKSMSDDGREVRLRK